MIGFGSPRTRSAAYSIGGIGGKPVGKIHWYKRDPDAALAGFFELTLEERGAYSTILDLIYSRCDDLPDDDRFIAGWLKCDVRVWRRIKTRLIALGKIKITKGRITNRRATSEILRCLSRYVSCAEAGRSSHPKSATVSNETKDIVETDAERVLEPTRTRTRKKEINNKESRLPADWKPERNRVMKAIDLGFDHDQIVALVEGFKAYWADNKTKKSVKSNWQQAFGNWIDNDIKFNGTPNMRPGAKGKLTKNQIAG